MLPKIGDFKVLVYLLHTPRINVNEEPKKAFIVYALYSVNLRMIKEVKMVVYAYKNGLLRVICVLLTIIFTLQ